MYFENIYFDILDIYKTLRDLYLSTSWAQNFSTKCTQGHRYCWRRWYRAWGYGHICVISTSNPRYEQTNAFNSSVTEWLNKRFRAIKRVCPATWMTSWWEQFTRVKNYIFLVSQKTWRVSQIFHTSWQLFISILQWYWRTSWSYRFNL